MSDGIFLLQGEKLVGMTEQPYDSEALLQDLLAKYPDLLAGGQMDPDEPRRWLLIAREAEVPGEEGGGARWFLDHLFLDQDAIPTIVEVKRSSDTRLRREVVGQMLDYAANAVVYWPVERIRGLFEESCRASGKERASPDEVLADFLDGGDPEHFWSLVKTNLQAGRVRMVFVADEIPGELRRIVEFLNKQMDPAEVLALEVRQFVGKDLKTLVPRIIGQDVKPPGARQWDEKSFMRELASRKGDKVEAVAGRILAWARQRIGEPWWGSGPQIGSVTPVLTHKGIRHQVFVLYTYGTFEVCFQYYASKPPFNDRARREEIRAKLNAIPGVSIPESKLEKKPGLDLSIFAEEGKLKQLLECLDWMVAEISKT